MLGMFYYTILNLPHILNSRLTNIHPLAVAKTSDINELGFDFVLNRVMSEIAELESDRGMLLKLPDIGEFYVQGTIVTLCSDTKGAHDINARLLAGPFAMGPLVIIQ